MSDHLIRVEHLKALQKTHEWNNSDLARACGRTPQQVRAWYSGERQIGERLARSLEEKLGLTRYALDERPSTPEGGNPLSDGAKVFSVGVTKRGRELPVISWTDIKAMLDVESSALKNKAPHLESFAVGSSRAKFVEMPDDSMAPEIQRGDHLLFDPVEVPRAGDLVLVAVPSGEHFVREFRPRTAHVFDAIARNAHYLGLSSKDDQAEVVAVLIEHRRYRRRSPP